MQKRIIQQTTEVSYFCCKFYAYKRRKLCINAVEFQIVCRGQLRSNCNCYYYYSYYYYFIVVIIVITVSFFDYFQKALVDMLARLVAIISQPSITEDMALTYQVALIDIKLLCRLLGKEHHGALSPAFVACTGLLQPQSIPLPVVGNALLCVAELCSCLRAHAIVHLAEFITPLMSLLRDLELLSGSSLLLNCVLCATQKLVSTLSNFLSPHMAQLVFAVSF